MIRRRDDTAIIITQTAHGWLAGQFALQWGNAAFQFPVLSNEVIMAAINHDNGWLAWEQKPEIGSDQRPLDFLEMPVASHVQIWQRGIQDLAFQSRYAALLVSLHGRTLVENRLRENRQDSPADREHLQTFSETQRAWEAATIAALNCQPYFSPGCVEACLDANLRLIQVFDWLSLLLCMDKLSESVIPDVPGAHPTQTVDICFKPTGPQSLTMSPWPFNKAAFTVTIQAHHLPQATFDSNKAFQAIWQTVAVKPLVFRVEG